MIRPVLLVHTSADPADKDAVLRDLVQQVTYLIAPAFPQHFPATVTVWTTPGGGYVATIKSIDGETHIHLTLLTLEQLRA